MQPEETLWNKLLRKIHQRYNAIISLRHDKIMENQLARNINIAYVNDALIISA